VFIVSSKTTCIWYDICTKSYVIIIGMLSHLVIFQIY